MKQFDAFYECAEGNFGLVTYAQAKSMGIAIRELDKWLKKGWIERPARGVYRASRFPASECEPYAIAVEAVGGDAYLYGESVLALLRLVPTNPTWIYVASPRRVRRKVGDGIVIVRGGSGCDATNYLGVRSQPLAAALVACGTTVRGDRRLHAAEEGLRQGYLGKEDFARIAKEIEDAKSLRITSPPSNGPSARWRVPTGTPTRCEWPSPASSRVSSWTEPSCGAADR